ncbi:sugar ABC transporter ATP-binding protein [Allonocardiopsis opalescens]|uniref:Monosaccharide ABC transporter ATP-binding protein (CUT2 family) n=1 Tax=Allonocardiopsis opalescens TaxID=1144618 RepID=A0A2T0Q0F1_9ACTN|nr:sugar ABC transporter ATP-binding protein [Allonocardiopsis opalescens]PRX97269.1 monosaccharide ABC transporter ATP-binding protein (CUT2 family) [Allonocardiopsis opalescens]
MSAAAAAAAAHTPGPAAELTGVSKSYGPVAALRRVDLRLLPGEVHCLAGENGAGKSTLIRILAGAEQRDGGTYTVAGRPVPEAAGPARARRSGVGVVYQELSLLPHLSVADNLLMGRLPNVRGLLRPRRQAELARAALRRVGLDGVDPDTPVEELPTATRQLVEIARVLDQDARVIVFDEPTTALAEHETERLLERIRELAGRGIAVLYVTHRIEEMFAIGHRVTVLRDGERAACRPIGEFTPDSLVESMVGRPIDRLYPDSGRRRPDAAPLLEVTGLRAPAFPEPVDFSVAAGEIVGLAGLMGSGRSELVRAVFGADRVTGGTVRVGGVPVPPNSPRAAAARGLGLLTEDRKEAGLLPELSIQENIAIAGYARGGRGRLLSPARTRRHAAGAIEGLGLKYRDLADPASALSGGNQQKMLLARWLALDARVLLLDEPTKGVDVGAKADIYRIIADLAASGKAVVVVSSYLPELLGLCDRIAVLRHGRIVADLSAAGTSEAEIARHASLDGGADPGTHPSPDGKE